MPTVFQARERQETRIPIDAVMRDGRFDLFQEVLQGQFFEVKFYRANLSIYAGKYIGYIPLNAETAVFVEPKFPVGNVLYVLDRAGTAIRELRVLRRHYGTAETAPLSILEAMASAYADDLAEIQVHGLLKRYVERDEEGQLPRGRISIGRSLQRFWSRGVSHRAAYSYYDQTVDVPENRILRYACHALVRQLRDRGGRPEVIQRVGNAEDLFAQLGVSLVHPKGMRDQPGEQTRAEYVRALRLADVLTTAYGIAPRSLEGNVFLPSVLIDLETAFEKFLLDVLRRKLSSGAVLVLDGNREGGRPLFHDTTQHTANPDIVVRRGPDCPVILDAKYRMEIGRDDINQMVAYAMAYGAPHAVVVRPCENPDERGLRHIGSLKGASLSEYRFFLGAENLDSEEDAFAGSIAALAA